MAKEDKIARILKSAKEAVQEHDKIIAFRKQQGYGNLFDTKEIDFARTLIELSEGKSDLPKVQTIADRMEEIHHRLSTAWWRDAKVVIRVNTADARTEYFVKFRNGYNSGILREEDAEYFVKAGHDIEFLLTTLNSMRESTRKD